MSTLVAGLDLGSTGVKLLVVDEQGAEVVLTTLPTPWHEDPAGAVVMSSEALLTVVDSLLREAAAALTDAASHVTVLSVTGMGESGFLLDADSRAVAPAYAWFDRSGQQQVDALPEGLRQDFAGRTGLPWGVQVSAAKIAHLASTGVPVAGTRWLSLPEYVVHALGGPAVAERSLVSRTGLVDLDTGRPWPELLAHLGVGADIVPPVVDAGTVVGVAAAGRVPAAFAGAGLAVAGHDHLVSTLSGDAGHAERYHVSMGTAEVLLRVVDTPLSFDARSRLGDYLINCVPHVLPGRWVVVAGVKTGLLMRRALAMLGVNGEEARRQLDQAVLALPDSGVPEALAVSGARNDDGVLSLTVGTDEVSPAAVMAAILEHGNEEIRRLVRAIDAELPPATSSLLTGGWTSWDSVRAARSRVLPRPRGVPATPGHRLRGGHLCPGALRRQRRQRLNPRPVPPT